MIVPTRTQRDDEARRRLLASLVLAVALHAGLFAALVYWTRARPPTLRVERPFMQLRLIDEPVATAPAVAPSVAPPSPTAPPPARPAVTSVATEPSRPSRVLPSAAPDVDAPGTVVESASTPMPMLRPASPSTSNAAALTAPIAETSALSPRIFHRDGSIDLPPADSSGGDPAAFGPRKRTAPYSPDPMVHRSPLPYEPTRFERYWAPRDESLLGEWVRNATRSKSWDTQGGTRISCSAFLFFGGCGWGPAPRVSIEELKRMRADPPMPRPSPLLPQPVE